jgi:hypothetical protein
MRAFCASVLAAGLLATAATAQDPAAYEPVRRDPLGTRLINVATPYPVRSRTLGVLFVHRFQQRVNHATSHDLWGLDGGADIGIGLAYGMTPGVEVEVYRSSFQETFEMSAKLLVFEQAAKVPVTVALRAGVDRLERPGVADPTRPFAQLLLARRLAPGVNLLAAPSWVADTPRLKDAVNVPVGLTFALGKGAMVELEYIPENRDLDASRQAWHLAFSKATGGHIFEVVVGNSRATTVDQMLGGDAASGFEPGDVRLGFNIVRDFSF